MSIKGSWRRPYSVPLDEYDMNYHAAFRCGKDDGGQPPKDFPEADSSEALRHKRKHHKTVRGKRGVKR